MSIIAVKAWWELGKMAYIFSYTGAEGRRDRGRKVGGGELSKPILSDILHVPNLLKVLHLPKQGPSAQTQEPLGDISFLA